MGVIAGDEAEQDAAGVAKFICAAAECDSAASAVQAALAAAAAQGGGQEAGGEAGDRVGEASSRLAAA
eukprot:3474028-Pleurochrysis_carterae.AAC.1